MNKKDYVKSLSNIKLVIGNGFDLHCGLHTSYFDYFKYNCTKYSEIADWYRIFNETKDIYASKYVDKAGDYNLWDVFFALTCLKDKSVVNDNWSNIESLILSSLITDDDYQSDMEKFGLYLRTPIHWNVIRNCFSQSKNPNYPEGAFIEQFLEIKEAITSQDYSDFYSMLLEQLKEFEKSFGLFIDWQLHDCFTEKYTGIALNEKYINNALSTFDNLSNSGSFVGIDSFNYSYISDNRIKEIFHYINGDYKAPIFGVDTTYFKPYDRRFVFTKTGRKIDADMLDPNVNRSSDFENVIVYGHSLDEADYSYFFPIFDKLDLLNSKSNGVIVFAFSIYDPMQKSNICASLRRGISDMICAYAKTKGILSPERFLDSLINQQKIITYEIPVISKTYENFLDIRWKDIEKKYKQMIQNIFS